jgi:hypothetical protein
MENTQKPLTLYDFNRHFQNFSTGDFNVRQRGIAQYVHVCNCLAVQLVTDGRSPPPSPPPHPTPLLRRDRVVVGEGGGGGGTRRVIR